MGAACHLLVAGAFAKRKGEGKTDSIFMQGASSTAPYEGEASAGHCKKKCPDRI